MKNRRSLSLKENGSVKSAAAETPENSAPNAEAPDLFRRKTDCVMQTGCADQEQSFSAGLFAAVAALTAETPARKPKTPAV